MQLHPNIFSTGPHESVCKSSCLVLNPIEVLLLHSISIQLETKSTSVTTRTIDPASPPAIGLKNTIFVFNITQILQICVLECVLIKEEDL
mmetsp:Transcript_18887/g.32494  ORF Transcript_18887/g.32494 Transcript_18887/m.32494 type:complete len:90 (-) Transcript_18887:431-700(-)